MAEKLRRRAVNPLGIPIVGANPTVLKMFPLSDVVRRFKDSLSTLRSWARAPGGRLRIAFWLVGATPEGGEGSRGELPPPPDVDPALPKEELPTLKERRKELRELLRRATSVRYEALDTHGFAEFPDAAWFTKEGRARRARSPHTQGPWGSLVTLAHTNEGWVVHFWFEGLLSVSVAAVFLALSAFPSPLFLGFAALAVWSGRASFAQLPLLEGADLEEGVWGLEAVSWADLSRDLRAWLTSEAAAMRARGETRCPSCTRLTSAEALDATAPRELDVVAESIALSVRAAPPVLDGAQDPLKLHPEAPSLERRAALQQLAWQLTQLAVAAGLTAEDALLDTSLDLDPSLSRWASFRQELRVEVYNALRREVSHTEHGHSEVLISIPFFLPTAIKWRRLHAPAETYGPLAVFRWPYRYPGGLLREVALEGAVLLCILGALLMGFAWSSLAVTTAVWWRTTFGGALIFALGLGWAGALAGGIENWGDSIDLPLTDPFREALPDPLPVISPVAPGPMRGWTWAEQVRRATCPLCPPQGAAGGAPDLAVPSRPFYEWYSLVPPVEWNGGFWRYWGGGYKPRPGQPAAPSQRGPRLETLIGGPQHNPFLMEEHCAHEVFRTEAWWHRGFSLMELSRMRAERRRAAARARRRARRVRISRILYGAPVPPKA
jgi:hypothetical protein